MNSEAAAIAERDIEPIPACRHGQHVLVVGIEGQARRTGAQLCNGVVSKPGVVPARPGVALVADDPAATTASRPGAGPGSDHAAVLAGSDQVAGSLLVDARDRDRSDLVKVQQPGQADRVPDLGLDPITRGELQLGRGRDLAPDPRSAHTLNTSPTHASAWRDPLMWSIRYESAGWVWLVQLAAYSAGVRSPREECGR